jgi:hypothetical protein
MEFDVKDKIVVKIDDKISQLQRLRATIVIDRNLTIASLERYKRMLSSILK